MYELTVIASLLEPGNWRMRIAAPATGRSQADDRSGFGTFARVRLRSAYPVRFASVTAIGHPSDLEGLASL